MHGTYAARIAPSGAEREQLAKRWLLAMIDRTPFPELGELPLRRLVAEAPALIAAICAALDDPAPGSELAAADRARIAQLAGLRSGPGAAVRIGHDLGELQALIVGLLRDELGGADERELARSAERLATVFGSIQGAVAGDLVAEARGAGGADPVTGFPGPAQLDRRLASLLAEQRRYGRGFSLALLDVDGLGRINDAYGRQAGDRMLVAVAAIVRRQMRDADGAFRLEQDELAIVAPHTDASGLATMARRIAQVISDSQSPAGPRIAIAAGVVGCPADGISAERLLESATEATYAAKASGAPVARSANGFDAALQDP